MLTISRPLTAAIEIHILCISMTAAPLIVEARGRRTPVDTIEIHRIPTPSGDPATGCAVHRASSFLYSSMVPLA